MLFSAQTTTTARRTAARWTAGATALTAAGALMSALPATADTGASGGWSAATDDGSLFALTEAYGVQRAWVQGVTGAGVTVAVVDTGIAAVAGLAAEPRKVTLGADLSSDPTTRDGLLQDGFGHGTHMASIIGGRDAGFDGARPSADDFAGVAPDARLLDVRVGSADGSADAAQVVDALDWVVEHNWAGGDVRVVSLAYGIESDRPWQVHPLARAVERAWDAGIVVVAAAGNDGLESRSLVMPAADPHILAVGAIDQGDVTDLDDDVVASFTNGGSDERRPDVVAPGTSLVGLRSPGSHADVTSPEGRVAGDDSQRHFRGTGTSQAAAFVAGQVALLLSERPELTPDEVKALLTSTARPVAAAHPATGAGVPDVLAAVAAPVPTTIATPSSSATTDLLEPSIGHGAFDSAWESRSWRSRSWRADTWESRSWRSRSWRADTWESRSWRADSWESRSWRSRSWR